MISSMSTFDKIFIKKYEYQEKGEENFSEIFKKIF
jgi:actin-related protein